MSERQEVPVADIAIGVRQIGLKPDVVDGLIESIQEVGLLNPIVVNRTLDGLELVAGLHRLTAYRQMGRKTIPATVASATEVTVRMAEVDENLVRGVLTAQERGLLTAERKRLYLLKHPETAAGVVGEKTGGRGRPKGIATAETATANPSFVQDTATKTRRGERTVREDVQIGTEIIPAAHVAIQGTPTANSKSDLLELTRVPKDQQGFFAYSLALSMRTKPTRRRRH